jgi:hypothetical protein
MRLSTTLGCLSAVLICAWIAWAAPEQENEQRQVPKEQQEMIDAAGKALEASAALYEVGAGGVTLEGVYSWSRRWADAQADGAAKGEQVKAFIAHRDRMQKLFEKVKGKFDSGVAGGERDKYEAARYYAAEADCLLLKKTPDAK